MKADCGTESRIVGVPVVTQVVVVADPTLAVEVQVADIVVARVHQKCLLCLPGHHPLKPKYNWEWSLNGTLIFFLFFLPHFVNIIFTD